MAPAESPSTLRVELALALGPRQVERVSLAVAPGTTAGEALAASGLLRQHGVTDLRNWTLAVWGRAADVTTALRDRDRVEVLRALQVDPKEARRLRYRSQAERRAGRRPLAPSKPADPADPA